MERGVSVDREQIIGIPELCWFLFSQVKADIPDQKLFLSHRRNLGNWSKVA
jgi:hypothetical protein